MELTGTVISDLLVFLMVIIAVATSEKKRDIYLSLFLLVTCFIMTVYDISQMPQ